MTLFETQQWQQRQKEVQKESLHVESSHSSIDMNSNQVNGQNPHKEISNSDTNSNSNFDLSIFESYSHSLLFDFFFFFFLKKKQKLFFFHHLATTKSQPKSNFQPEVQSSEGEDFGDFHHPSNVIFIWTYYLFTYLFIGFIYYLFILFYIIEHFSFSVKSNVEVRFRFSILLIF